MTDLPRAVLFTCFLTLSGLVTLLKGNAYVISRENETSTLVQRAVDPTDFGWVHRFAAIGDSFTSGIGSGSQLGETYHWRDDWDCMRYDQSYPMIVNNVIGPSIDEFQVSHIYCDTVWICLRIDFVTV